MFDDLPAPDRDGQPDREAIAQLMKAGFTEADAKRELWLAENGGDCRVIEADGTEHPAPTFEEVLAHLEDADW